MNNIYLIGMPGSGKSTLGRAVSEKLNMTFADTDEIIERKIGMPVSGIFEKYGESHFRLLETECISELSMAENFVVATGGGLPVRAENRDIMRTSGTVIYIDVDLDILIKRSAFGGRPLLQGDGVKKLKALYGARRDIYKDAASEVFKSGDNVDYNVKKLVEKLTAK